MQKELLEALKMISAFCDSHNDCEICPLSHWCDCEFGMSTPDRWWIPTEEE